MNVNRFQSEKLTITNLLFTKAIPNYTLPIPTDGHFTYVCTDCGDRFIIKSSYEYHINRKSMKITYFCRHCKAEKIFFNRCDLLSHIRRHPFKIAAISVGDLKIEPLPLTFYNFQSQVNSDNETPAIPLPCLINENNTELHNRTKVPLTSYNFQSQLNSDIETPATPLPCLINQNNTKLHNRTKVPLTSYNFQSQLNSDIETPASPLPCLINQNNTELHNRTKVILCFDCKKNIYSSGIEHTDRVKHFTENTYKLYVCPICLLSLSSQCALKAHLRIHLMEPPYVCPECGLFLTNAAVVYPFNHYCESFKMLRVAAKMQCKINNCNKKFHPTYIDKHLRLHHLKQVYKCPICNVACYKLDIMQKHIKVFHVGKFKKFEIKKWKQIDFVQCDMCPGKFVIPAQIEKHFKSHQNGEINFVYPCWICGVIINSPKNLLNHHKFCHPESFKEKMFGKFSGESNAVSMKNSNIKTNNLIAVPNQCNKCLKIISKYTTRNLHLVCKCASETPPKIVCNLCQHSITQDWNIIKKHFAIFHKELVCLDVKILLKKMNINKYKRVTDFLKKQKKINPKENASCMMNDNVAPESITKNLTLLDNNKFICRKCNHDFESKLCLENHMVKHKDPFMAYQCMECGESFVAKPSFSTHLFVKHGINNVNDYIVQKKCYSKDSINLQKLNSAEEHLPVKENQCNICREQFYNSTDFEKHFRVHGMAFLLKNTNKSVSL